MTEPIPQEDEIRRWLVDKLAERLRVAPGAIDLDEPLVAIGLDSMQFVVLVGELEDWLDCRFTSNPLVDYPSVNALSRFLAAQLRAGNKRIDPVNSPVTDLAPPT